MGQVMTLAEVSARLDDFDQLFTIYAATPWNTSSSAIVEIEPPAGGIPEYAKELDLLYFLEVHIAKYVRDGLVGEKSIQPSTMEICERIINYAVNDA
jgi:hypothetical protein